MTDLQREENARILLSHSRIKPEFVPHSGQFISDLCDTVLRRVDYCEDKECPNCGAFYVNECGCGHKDEPEFAPGLCGRCFNQREIAVNLPNGDYEIRVCLECAL